MVEILKANFDEQFENIETSIRTADFIAIDTEFTGLHLSDRLRPSLFDESETRYQKLRENFTKFTITQFGLATFQKANDSDTNKYTATAYNFFLFPPSFGSLDSCFTVQASSFAFHKQSDFDFNKYVYGGLSFLNEESEAVARKIFAEKQMSLPVVRNVDEESLQSLFSQISEWYQSSDEGQVMMLDKDASNVNMRNHILAPILLDRLPLIWVSTNQDGQLLLEKVSEEQRALKAKDKSSQQESRDHKVLEDLLGFSRVFKILVECKKPLVGHNMLLDLLLIYDKFYKPLPANYEQFKSSLLQIFPMIYDTKHMSHCMKKYFEDHDIILKTALERLYDMLQSTKGQQVVIHAPSIELSESSSYYNDFTRAHEAGYDAYMCGCVFLKLAHIFTFKDHKSTQVSAYCNFRRYIADTREFQNKVNIIRANIHHVCLQGKDSKANRPILFVSSKSSSYKLNPVELASWCSKYGTVDIKLHNPRYALLATGHPNIAKDIEKAVRKTKQQVDIVKFVPWKHTIYMYRPWILAGVCITITSGVIAAALFSRRKSTS